MDQQEDLYSHLSYRYHMVDYFPYGKYDDMIKINEFIDKVDLVTFEFENIPYNTLDTINKTKKVLPSPKINKIIQNRLFEKNFINELNIKTTKYISIKNNKDLKLNSELIPGILKTCTLGYDGKGQYKINSIEDINNLKVNFKSEVVFMEILII